ncbi:hypothetical protein [Candidatus Acetatifactor stercoripullorum]|uniref:hypothetical protein n=1 Tax=Candidatus Acetatifactor stercoripullorum TaxID=2838414 RepID=UPI00298DDA0F|nr:hypothetical protein [Candidatus Acetatifactor stercoripullorum]
MGKVDFGLKYVFFELDKKRYLISFRDTFLKGVHDVEVSTGTDGKGYGKEKAVIEECYPGFLARAKARITFWKARSKWFRQ